MDDRSKPEYEVGYGKPPLNGRFQKGSSGNPAGRPRGAKGLIQLLEAELAVQIEVTEGGRRRTVSKGKALIKQMVNQGLKGRTAMLKILFDILAKIETEAEIRRSSEDGRVSIEKVQNFLKQVDEERLRQQKGSTRPC